MKSNQPEQEWDFNVPFKPGSNPSELGRILKKHYDDKKDSVAKKMLDDGFQEVSDPLSFDGEVLVADEWGRYWTK